MTIKIIDESKKTLENSMKGRFYRLAEDSRIFSNCKKGHIIFYYWLAQPTIQNLSLGSDKWYQSNEFRKILVEEIDVEIHVLGVTK